MADYSDLKRLLKLTTPLGADKLLVLGYSGSESISGLFEFTLDLAAPRSEMPDVSKIIGKGATLAINASLAGDFEAEGKRFIHGIINQFAEVGRLNATQDANATDYLRFSATLVPWLWTLTQAADCRIFQNKTVPDILEAVFKARGFNDFRSDLTGKHAARTYCVQYRETDFDFVSRLMEDEGIYYFFEHTDSKHTLVLADAKNAHKGCAPAAGVALHQNERLEIGRVRSWSDKHVLTTAKYALQSYNFETPSTSLLTTTDTTVTVGKNTALEVYDYAHNYLTKADGDSQAALRMEAIEASHKRVEFTSDCAYLKPGYKFKLTGHYRTDQNQEYLIVNVRHAARNGGYGGLGASVTPEFDNVTVCMPASVQYRDEVKTPAPTIQGIQTALVVGPSSEEIYTDKYGRIKVQFHWDRKGQKNESSSCWIRVAQSVASNQWGAQFLPRVGQEVLVDFLDGDPDQPIVSGAVYNAQKMPTYALPNNKTQSGFKSRSTAQGAADNFNELRFEDKKGSEDIYFQAEKDFHRMVKNDDDLKVGHDQTIEIKNNRTETIKEGNESVTVEKGNRTVKISQGNEVLDVAKGSRTTTIAQGNETLKISKGNRSVEVSMGNDQLTIKQGNQVTKIDLGKSETEAMQSIEFKVGANSIKIEQSGITIKGTMVKVEGQGQAEFKGAMVKVEAQGMAEFKSGGMAKVEGAMVQVNGQGMTQVKAGGMVQVQGAINMIG